MKKIALISSEPIRTRMAGIGIRYHQMACCLIQSGFDVEMFCPSLSSDSLSEESVPYLIREFDRNELEETFQSYNALVAQGQLAAMVAQANISTPMVFDLCDPYPIENLSYLPVLGEEIYNSNFKEWRVQLERGDFFLCATDAQRSYNFGYLSALNRLDSKTLASDPTLSTLFGLTPFGISDDLPRYRKVLPDKSSDVFRILFGGLYDWYDPWTLLKAIEQHDDVQVIFVSSPNLETTPQTLFEEVKQYCTSRNLTSDRVTFIKWQEYDRRFDLLRDVDMLVAPHPHSIETQLSLRTRFLEAMAVGCPVICSQGGGIAEIVHEIGGGIVTPVGDHSAVSQAITTIKSVISNHYHRFDVSNKIVERYSWKRTLEPLVSFLKRVTPPSHIHRPVSSLPDRHFLGDSKLFSIVIPTFNRMDIFPEVITALEQQKQAPDFEVIIVNDGSSDGTSAWLKNRKFNVEVTIIETENQGPGKARSEALLAVKGDYIVLLGDDMVPEPYWLYCHYHAHKRREFSEDIAVIGHTDWHHKTLRTRFLNFVDQSGWQFAFHQIDDPENVPFNYFYGSNLSISSQWLRQYSFNKRFPYPAWEDIELGYRLTVAGLNIKYEPAARTAHLHQTTIKRFCQRQWKAGYSAVLFYQLHPELESLFWPSGENLSRADSGLKKTIRSIIARTLEKLPVDLEQTWNLILRDHYVSGLRQALRDSGTRIKNLASKLSLLPLSIPATSPLLKHQCGQAEGQYWCCISKLHKKGHCIYGPYFTLDQNQSLYVEFQLDWAEREATGLVATLDVYDSREDKILKACNLFGEKSPKEVKLEFQGQEGQTLEFRVFWHGRNDLRIKNIKLGLVESDSGKN